jgi:hypothetical protein
LRGGGDQFEWFNIVLNILMVGVDCEVVPQALQRAYLAQKRWIQAWSAKESYESDRLTVTISKV